MGKFNNRSSVSRHKRRVHKNENIKQEITHGPTQYTSESVDDTATETEKVIGDMDETKAVADPKKETKEVVNPILCQICKIFPQTSAICGTTTKGPISPRLLLSFTQTFPLGLYAKNVKILLTRKTICSCTWEFVIAACNQEIQIIKY